MTSTVTLPMQTIFVTLNWNTTDYLFAMLDSIETTVPEDHRWVIVDNGSRPDEHKSLVDGLLRRFGEGVRLFPEARDLWDLDEVKKVCLIEAEKNLGCVLGHNLAFDLAEDSAKGELYEIVMLDTDVEVYQSGWLEIVRQFYQAKDIGIVGMEHGADEVCAGAVSLDPNGNWYLHRQQLQDPTPIKSESVGLGFALIGWKVTKAGLRFDTGFELYYKQDDDLCFQVRSDLGLEVWVYPIDSVHYGSAGLKINNYDVGDYHGWDPFHTVKGRNQTYFAKKWDWALRDRRQSVEEEQVHLDAIARVMNERRG